MNSKLIKALKARYKAQAAEAQATIDVYLNNAAGIGEHPQIVDEMAKQLEILSNADDNLMTLERYYEES
jgi:hypothetical protein|tara:strand:+ start:275 stop:481 length:207 start_codon:yes stop_codon:yes gene_type:complete